MNGRWVQTYSEPGLRKNKVTFCTEHSLSYLDFVENELSGSISVAGVYHAHNIRF